jgi:multiple sugar transport system substrate-binding protein
MLHTKARSGAGCNGSWGLGIAQTSKHPDEAWRAIAYLTSAQGQRPFILDTGDVPSRKVLFSDSEIVRKYPYIPKLSKAVENSVLRPPIPQYADVSDILQHYLSAALTKQLSPEQAMKKAADETRKLLGNN